MAIIIYRVWGRWKGEGGRAPQLIHYIQVYIDFYTALSLSLAVSLFLPMSTGNICIRSSFSILFTRLYAYVHTFLDCLFPFLLLFGNSFAYLKGKEVRLRICVTQTLQCNKLAGHPWRLATRGQEETTKNKTRAKNEEKENTHTIKSWRNFKKGEGKW